MRSTISGCFSLQVSHFQTLCSQVQNEMLVGLRRQWEEWLHQAEELMWQGARDMSGTGQDIADLKAVRLTAAHTYALRYL